MGTVAITGLAQWLAALDAPGLERVTMLRSDVLLGAPVRDVTDLAERLVHPASVATVLREVPAPALQVLEVLAALGNGASSERAAAFLDPAGRDAARQLEAVTAWTEHLVACALAWPDGTGRIRLNPGVVVVLGAPLGLGMPGALLVADVAAADLQRVARCWGLNVPKRKVDVVEVVLGALGDAATVRRLVGDAPPEVTETLLQRAREATAGMVGGTADHADHADPEAGDSAAPSPHLRKVAEYGRHRVAAAWALENGLAYGPRWDPRQAQLPCEVLLALAGPGVHARFAPDHPAVPTSPVATEQVRAA